MGKGSKTPEKGTKYNLIHRSARDEAHAGEENPSDMVLVPAVSANAARRQRKGKDSNNLSSTSLQANTPGIFKQNFSAKRDHINALGLPNDGYDYSQHLRSMGQGKFIGKDGKETQLPEAYRRETIVPEDLMPSAGDLDRHLEAITLDERTMDPDLLAALWGEADETGERFEELDDDFCVQAMKEADANDAFDWDKHMAMLIARSEQMSGVGTSRVKPRGWEGQKGAVARMANAHAIAGQEEGQDDVDEEENSDDSGWVPDLEEEDEEENSGNLKTAGNQDNVARLTASRLAAKQGNQLRARSGSGDEGTETGTLADNQSEYSLISKGGTHYSARSGGRFKPRSAARVIAEERARQERMFESTLAEYDDENIGDLEHLYDDEVEEDPEEWEEIVGEGSEMEYEEAEIDDEERAVQAAAKEAARAKRSIVGTIGLDELDTHPAFLEALDEFMEMKKEEQRVNGIHVIHGAREIHALENYVDPVPFMNVKESVAALEKRQLEDEIELREAMVGDQLISMADLAAFKSSQFEKNRHDELASCQDYLREEREENEWDCETVLSTYSTLDNHPKLLREPRGSKYTQYKSRFQVQQEREQAESEEVAAVEGGREALTKLAYQAPRADGGVGRPDRPQPARIVLAGKLSLPEGYGGDAKTRRRRNDGADDEHSVSSRFTVKSSATGIISVGTAKSGSGASVRLRMPQPAPQAAIGSRSHLRTETRFGLTTLAEETAHADSNRSRLTGRKEEPLISPAPVDDDKSDDEDSNEEDEERRESDEETGYTQWTRASRKAETPEEKKARKAAAKEEQRIKRLNKKALRTVYKEETEKVHRAEGRKQTTDHVSVFKYSIS